MNRLTDTEIAKCLETDTWVIKSDAPKNKKECDVEELYIKLSKYENIEEDLGIELTSAIDLLKWFIDNTMIASELMEFKKSSVHNERFNGWSHNGYSIQDEQFEKMRDLARTIKYKNGVRH